MGKDSNSSSSKDSQQLALLIPIVGCEGSKPTNVHNVASNVIHTDPSTYFSSAAGVGKAFLTVKVDKPRAVNTVKIAFLKGDQRKTKFAIFHKNSKEEDGGEWKRVRPTIFVANGTNQNLQQFQFETVTATEFKIVFLGNIDNSNFSGPELTKQYKAVGLSRKHEIAKTQDVFPNLQIFSVRTVSLANLELDDNQHAQLQERLDIEESKEIDEESISVDNIDEKQLTDSVVAKEFPACFNKETGAYEYVDHRTLAKLEEEKLGGSKKSKSSKKSEEEELEEEIAEEKNEAQDARDRDGQTHSLARSQTPPTVTPIAGPTAQDPTFPNSKVVKHPDSIASNPKVESVDQENESASKSNAVAGVIQSGTGGSTKTAGSPTDTQHKRVQEPKLQTDKNFDNTDVFTPKSKSKANKDKDLKKNTDNNIKQVDSIDSSFTDVVDETDEEDDYIDLGKGLNDDKKGVKNSTNLKDFSIESDLNTKDKDPLVAPGKTKEFDLDKDLKKNNKDNNNKKAS